MNLRQVKRLDFHIHEENKYVVREVVQKFHKIRYLTLDLWIDKKSAFDALKDMPILQNLIGLEMWRKGVQRCDFIINCLKQMTKIFPNLKKIQFNREIVLEKNSDFEQLMSSLKAFPHLKRLNITLKFSSGLEFDEIFSFKCFPQQLTHLKLSLNSVPTLKWSLIEGLDIHLPKLLYLFIRYVFITDEEGVQRMADILSRLSSLQKINLCFKYERIFELMKAKIIEKCRKIKF